MERLEKEQIQLMGIISSLKAQRDFECLKGAPEYLWAFLRRQMSLKQLIRRK